MSLQTLFLPGVILSEVERPRSWQSDPDSLGWSYAHSQALVCPRCLKQWAVLSFSEAEHHVQGAWCERCQPAQVSEGIIPGSILGNYNIDEPLLESLPPELLKREALLHLREYARRIHDLPAD